jgi:hypothetical protein
MSCRLVIGLFVLSVSVVLAGEAKDPLAPGNKLPGSFHPFNVTTVLPSLDEPEEGKEKPKRKSIVEPYTSKNKFHCLISEYDIDPVVMVFARGIDDNAALQQLLKDVDATIDRNRKVMRLRAFVVFLYDDLTNLVEQDDKREELAKKLEKLADDLKLRSVVLTISCKADLDKYRLPDDAALTAVLYRKLRIVSTFKLGRDKLDKVEAIKPILADVKDKLGATR